MEKKGYTLVWQDEFDYEGAPDPEKWYLEVGNFQWPNQELQAYTDRPGNVFVKDGCLHICGRKEKDGEREYTSAKVTTQHRASWKYGYFEFRAKLPRGVGSWPAIWMMPDFDFPSMPEGIPESPNGRPRMEEAVAELKGKNPLPDYMKWPNCGEIDIMEHVGREENRVLFSLHCKNHNHADKSTIPYTTAVQFPDDFCQEFHLFALEWTEDHMEFFVDDVSYCIYRRSDDRECQGYDSWPFDQPFYLIFNIAIGGGLGGAVNDAHLPFVFQVDYVRIYQ